MTVDIYQVDAFTSMPFAGNPAAVCLLATSREEDWMQAVAREMNLSETAFLVPFEDGYRLRWFTPAVEVELCGHATLASAHVLWETGALPKNETARFHTLSGLLTATQKDGFIELDFPAKPAQPAEPPSGLLQALDVDAVAVGRSAFDILVEVASEQSVRRLAPDMIRLGQVDARGIIVTSPAATDEFDFVSRFFAPAVGVAEDPVTGSAHCTLAPYWGERLGKTDMTAYQASARGGVVKVRREGDRVILGGQAVTVLRGTLLA